MYFVAVPIQAFALSILLGQLILRVSPPIWRLSRQMLQNHEPPVAIAKRATRRRQIRTQPANYSIRASDENTSKRENQNSRTRYPPRTTIHSALDTNVSIRSATMPERLNQKLGTAAPLIKGIQLDNFAAAKSEVAILPPKVTTDCTVKIHAQPTCNDAHETDINHSLSLESLRRIHFGGTRNVWRVIEDQSIQGIQTNFTVSFALKTLRSTRPFSMQTYELQRKEAVSLNYLSNTPGVVGIYGYCGTTLLSEYANRDTLSAFLKKTGNRTHPIHPVQLLQIAWRLARAVANIQGKSRANTGVAYMYENTEELQVIHRDLDASNILMTRNHSSGTWDVRLDDFNQAYVLKHSSEVGSCSYQDRFICGEDGRRTDSRAPEECRGDEELSNKVDTHGLGTVLFYLLTRRRVYNLDADTPGPANEHIIWYRERVKQGATPQLPESVESDNDKAMQAIITAMKMCMQANPAKRPSAQKVANYLLKAFRAYIATPKVRMK